MERRTVSGTKYLGGNLLEAILYHVISTKTLGNKGAIIYAVASAAGS